MSFINSYRFKPPAPLPFIFSVTVTAGQSFQLPTHPNGAYDCVIDWGDSTSDVLTIWNDPLRVHTYTAVGTYDIIISGVFKGWGVNNYSDRLKITNLKQWGILDFSNGNIRQFWGCNNMIVTATDLPNLSSINKLDLFMGNCRSIVNIPNLRYWDVSTIIQQSLTFNDCTLFDGSGLEYWNVAHMTLLERVLAICPANVAPIGLWVTTAVENIDGLLRGNTLYNSPLTNWVMDNVTIVGGSGNQAVFTNCINFNQPVDHLNWLKVISFRFFLQGATAFNQTMVGVVGPVTTDISSMLRNCPDFDQSLASWIITGITDATNFLSGGQLSTLNYDDTLISWSAQAVQPNVTIHFGTSKYSAGPSPAATARLILTSAPNNWIITDGGPI